MMIRRTGAVGFALFFIIVTPLFAQEGNYRFETYGNQSVLLSGNVTGSAEDLGLTYYNPAQLAFIEDPQIVIAGKAFQLINYDLEDVFESEIDISESSFNGIPSILSGTFKLKFLPNHHFAYSFISRYRFNFDLDYSSGVRNDLPIGAVGGDVFQSYTELSFRDRVREEWYGITWSHKLRENFALGVSLFGSIYESNGNSVVFIGLEDDVENVATYISRIEATQKTYGLFIRMGAAWQLNKVSLGLNIAAPFIAFKQRANLQSEEFLSGFGAPEDFFRVIDLEDLANKRRTATTIAFGMGIPMGKSKLHLSADYAFPLSEYERIKLPDLPEELGINQNSFLEEYRAVFNYGAGADVYLSPSVRLYLGFSSDYGATRDSPNLFDVVNQSDENINLFGDFWHFSLGPDFNFKWGKVTLGATYSRSSNQINTETDIPDGEDDGLSLTTAIGYNRWRFLIGLEIPLISEKVPGGIKF